MALTSGVPVMLRWQKIKEVDIDAAPKKKTVMNSSSVANSTHRTDEADPKQFGANHQQTCVGARQQR